MNGLGNKKIMSENLKHFINMSKKDRSQIAAELKVPYSTFTDWVNGNKYPRIDKIEMLASYFGVQKSDLIEERKEDSIFNIPNALPIPHMHKIPLIGDIACGTPIMAEQNIQDMVSCPDDIHADFCLRCHGDSMINARIYDGDVVYVHKQQEVENGEIAAVEILDGCESEATLKRFYRNGSTVTLMPENPKYEPIVLVDDDINKLKVDGKAVYFVSKIK